MSEISYAVETSTWYPLVVQQRLEEFHASDEEASDTAFDSLLGINYDGEEQEIRKAIYNSPVNEYKGEDIWLGGGYVWSRYSTIRSVVKQLELTSGDTVYDLGSGYGRFPLYVGLATSATARGIEIVPQRVAVATAAKERLGLSCVDFHVGNVLDHDFSDGTVFYMFNPFSEPTFHQVRARLKAIAAEKPITIAASACQRYFNHEDWLVPVTEPYSFATIYKSVP